MKDTSVIEILYDVKKKCIQLRIHIFLIQEEARKHFNCPNLDGVDIENEGGQGTVGTHFEKRVVGVS